MSTENTPAGTPATPPAGAPATPPAQAPATTTPPAAAPAQTPTPDPASNEPTVFTYEPTGNASLDIALDFFGKAGLDAADPALAGALQGNFDVLKARLAAQNKPGWEHMVKIAEDAWNAEVAKATEKHEGIHKMLNEVSGGEWSKVADWVSDNGELEERQAVAAAIDGGGVVGRIVAEAMVNQYRAATGTTVEPKTATATNAPAHAAYGGGALSPEQYRAEMANLVKTGWSMQAEQELDRRRALWR